MKNVVENKSKKTFFMSHIVMLFVFAFLMRLLFSFLPSFSFDMNAWLAWATRMKSLGPAGFYSDTVWTQYTPLMLYYLWFLAKIGLANELVIKATVTLCDLAVGLVIRKLVLKNGERLANLAFILYVLNPITIFVGPVWGQVDGILTLFILLSAYFWVEKKDGIFSGILFGLSFLLKPQAFIFLIPAFFIGLYQKYNFRKYVELGFFSGVTAFLLSIPFFPNNIIFGLPELLSKMTSHYNFTSVFAFNFWSLVGMWKDDSALFAGLTYQLWGIILFSLFCFLIFWQFNRKNYKKYSYLIFGLSFFAAFLFPTRVHERYLFPAFAFLLIAAFRNKSKLLFVSYLALSFLSMINLYHSYAYFSDNFLKNQTVLDITSVIHVPILIFSLVIFFGIIFFYKGKNNLYFKKINWNIFRASNKKSVDVFPTIKISEKSLNIALIVILLFSFFTRVLFISSPEKEYFDEVYHAFTAKKMLEGDLHAWDWEGHAPEGFAYEWTHPPVAKLGMMAGMVIFGKNSFGWRIPGVLFGVLSVFLVYAVAKELFKDKLLGILSAGLFSLEGLPLVMSRIGMNDMYLLAFVLFTFYFYIKGKPIYSAISFGFAFASKWSAIWILPLLVFYHVAKRIKFSKRYLTFFLLPPLIYLATYTPFFTEGRSFDRFFNFNTFVNCIHVEQCSYPYGLQQQMLWYHTNLKATHAYMSPWWSWPFDIRPVYLYTSGTELPENLVSRIYLFGNPIFFWFGLTSVVLIMFSKNRMSKNIAIVLTGYLIFFVPWALSPRIMFLYHYLPSIPFLSILMAYFLRKNPRLVPIVFPVLFITFVYFYPHWTGTVVPKWLDLSYYWFSSWR